MVKYYSIGDGASGYTEPNAKAAGFVNAANNGLSKSTITPNDIVLGQDQGQAGDPAKLLSNRDVPLNGFMQQWLQNVLTDFVQILRAQVLVGGSPLNGAVPTIGLADFDDGDQLIMTIDAGGVHIQFGGGGFINYKNVGGWIFTGNPVDFIGGFGGPMPTILFPGGGSTNPTGAGIIVDTSGGNCAFTFDPVAMKDRLFWVKKKTTDVNTITITPSSGSIIADAGAAANYVFSAAGAARLIFADGTNLYVL